MENNPESSRPDSTDKTEAALYARAAHELGAESADGPLRERIYDAIRSDAVVTRRILLPVRPHPGWKGPIAVGLVALASATGLVVFGQRALTPLSFADVEQAMKRVETASWTTTVETNVSANGKIVLNRRDRTESWVRFSSPPRLVTRQLGVPPPLYKGGRILPDEQLNRFATYPHQNTFFYGIPLSASSGNPVSVSDGRSVMTYTPDRRWYVRSTELSPPVSSASPAHPSESLSHRAVFFSNLPLASAAPGDAAPPFQSLWYPLPSSYFRVRLTSAWCGAWRGTAETFRGKPSLRFENKVIRTLTGSGPDEWTCVEDWTIRVDPTTRRILWREIAGSHDGTSNYRITSDDFRYDGSAPAGIFNIPVPEVGKRFQFFDQPGGPGEYNRADAVANGASGPIRRAMEQVIDAWNRQDVDAILGAWDFGYVKAQVQESGAAVATPDEAMDRIRKILADRIAKGSPWKNWRVRGVNIEFAAPSHTFTRSSESEPFPPEEQNYFAAVAQVESAPGAGQPPVYGQVRFQFRKQGDAFRLIGLRFPQTLSPHAPAKPAATPPKKATPSGTGIGKTFRSYDQPESIPVYPQTNIPTGKVPPPMRRVIDQTIDAWNRLDWDAFCANWDFEASAARTLKADTSAAKRDEVAATKRRDWMVRIGKSSTFKNWRVRGVTINFTSPTSTFTRNSDSEPFPPQAETYLVAIVELEAPPAAGQPATYGQAAFRFRKRGDEYRIIGLDIPDYLKPAPAKPATKPPVKATPSGTGTRPAGRP